MALAPPAGGPWKEQAVMSIVNDYFSQPNKTNRQALLESCWCWADSAADSLSSATPRPHRPGSLHALRCSRIAWTVQRDISGRLNRAVKGNRAGNRLLSSSVCAQLTDGFFQGSKDEVERHAAFRDFVIALACYHALSQAQSKQERKSTGQDSRHSPQHAHPDCHESNCAANAQFILSKKSTRNWPSVDCIPTNEFPAGH